MPYYSVARGVCPGIYTSWEECHKQIHRYSGAKFKRFDDKTEAERYLLSESVVGTSGCLDSQSSHPSGDQTGVVEDVGAAAPYGEQNIGTTEHGILIFTDGSCKMRRDGTRLAGYGYYIPVLDKKVSRRLPPPCTNNRAELVAIISAVNEFPPRTRLHIVTDSKYSILIFTTTGLKYARNNFLNDDGSRVVNSDLVQIAVQLSSNYDLHFTHINSHTNLKDIYSIGNDIADKLATGEGEGDSCPPKPPGCRRL